MSTGDLPKREPGASGYQLLTEGDLSMTARLIMPPMAVPLADPEDPALWERVEEALRGYGITMDDER